MLPEHQEVETDPPMALKATFYPDIMYMHKAMKEEDEEEFKKTMQKESDNQYKNGNFLSLKGIMSQREPIFYLRCGKCNINEISKPDNSINIRLD